MKLIKKIFSILKNPSSSLRDQMVHGVSWSFLLKVISLGIGFISSILIARILGVENFGNYSFAITLTELLIMFSTLGFPVLIAREISKNVANQQWGLLSGLVRRSQQISIPFAIVISLLAILLGSLIEDKPYSNMYLAFLMAAPLVIIGTSIQLQAAILQGLKFIIASQISSLIIQRLGFVVILSFLFFYIEKETSIYKVISAQIFMASVALLCSIVILSRRLPKQIYNIKPTYNTSIWIKSALTFLLINGAFLINKQTDILMIGTLMESADVGVYRAAIQGAELVAIALTVVNIVLLPSISSLYEKGEISKLQKLITMSTRMVTVVCLPIFIFLYFFGNYFLLLFGNEFLIGSKSLAILSVGQLMNAFFGSVGLILSMTGHEKDTLQGVAISALINIILNIAFIPVWGIEGAAYATTSSLIIWNVLLAYKVIKRTGLHSTALGVLHK